MGEVDKRAWPAFHRVVGAAGGASIGVLAALALGPEAAGILGNASGPLVEELSYAVEQLLRRQIGRVQTATEEAVSEGNCTVEELLQQSLADDRRAAVMTAALQAAAVAHDEATVKALGRAYARGVLTRDDAKVDEQRRVVSALAALEPVDVRVLHLMRQGEWIKHPVDGRKIPAIVDADPRIATVVDAVVARLSTEGLIASDVPGMLSSSRFEITAFGLLCLSALAEVGHQATCDEAHPTVAVDAER